MSSAGASQRQEPGGGAGSSNGISVSSGRKKDNVWNDDGRGRSNSTLVVDGRLHRRVSMLSPEEAKVAAVNSSSIKATSSVRRVSSRRRGKKIIISTKRAHQRGFAGGGGKHANTFSRPFASVFARSPPPTFQIGGTIISNSSYKNDIRPQHQHPVGPVTHAGAPSSNSCQSGGRQELRSKLSLRNGRHPQESEQQIRQRHQQQQQHFQCQASQPITMASARQQADCLYAPQQHASASTTRYEAIAKQESKVGSPEVQSSTMDTNRDLHEAYYRDLLEIQQLQEQQLNAFHRLRSQDSHSLDYVPDQQAPRRPSLPSYYPHSKPAAFQQQPQQQSDPKSPGSTQARPTPSTQAAPFPVPPIIHDAKQFPAQQSVERIPETIPPPPPPFEFEFQQQTEYLRQQKEKLRRHQEALKLHEEELRKQEALQIEQEEHFRKQQEQYRMQQELERQQKQIKQQQILQEQREQEQDRILLEQQQQKILDEHRKIQQRQLEFQQDQLMFQREQKQLAEEQHLREEQYKAAMAQFQRQQEERDAQVPLSFCTPPPGKSEGNLAPLSVRLQTPYMGASSERTPPNAIIEMLERTPAASPPSPFSSLAVSQAPVPTPLREAQLRWSSAVNQWKVLSKSQEKHREDLSEVASVMTEATAAAESIWSKDENSLGDFDGDEGKTYLTELGVSDLARSVKVLSGQAEAGQSNRKCVKYHDEAVESDRDRGHKERNHYFDMNGGHNGGSCFNVNDADDDDDEHDDDLDSRDDDDEDEAEDEDEDEDEEENAKVGDGRVNAAAEGTISRNDDDDCSLSNGDHLGDEEPSSGSELHLSNKQNDESKCSTASKLADVSSTAGLKAAAQPANVASSEIVRLQKHVLSQCRIQNELEKQITLLQSKLLQYDDNLHNQARGSKKALDVLTEKQKMMEMSEVNIKSQLLEAKAASSLVQHEISSNLCQQKTITNLMHSHKTFTSAYEMRVAELESENGELHGFMTALLKDSTLGMLSAVLGFYRGRYFENGEFKGATSASSVEGDDNPGCDGGESSAPGAASKSANTQVGFKGFDASTRIPTATTTPSMQQPFLLSPNHEKDTSTSSIRKRATILSSKEGKDTRRESWFSGGMLAGEMFYHHSQSQKDFGQHLVDEKTGRRSETLQKQSAAQEGGEIAGQKPQQRQIRAKTQTTTPTESGSGAVGRGEIKSGLSPKGLLPARWFMAVDSSSGLKYWYNPWNGDTTWHKPAGFDEESLCSPPKVFRATVAGYSNNNYDSFALD